MGKMKNKFVVYTALFGDYDKLIDPPKKYDSINFICFTDQKDLKSNIWDIKIVNSTNKIPNMLNREFKFFPNKYFSEYQYSLYIDSNIRLLSNPITLFEKYLSNNLIAIPNHWRRNCIYKEAQKCIEIGKVELEIANRQMQSYMKEGYPENNGLGEMNIIFRKHNDDKIIKLMNDWWNQLNQFSQRDQLSFCYVAWKNSLDYKFIDESSRRFDKYFFAECHKHDPMYHKIKRFLKKNYYKVKLRWS